MRSTARRLPAARSEPMSGAGISNAALAAQANALKAAGRLEGAIALYERIAESEPDSAIAEHNLAAALGDDNRFAESARAARRAFDKGIDAPETWLVLGRALQGLGRFDEADATLLQAITRRPTYAEAHQDLAQLRWMRGDGAGAATLVLDRALAAAPLDPQLVLAKARVMEFAGDPASAYALVRRALAAGVADGRLEIVASELCRATD